MTAAHSDFNYVTYIRTTPAKLWEALTSAAFMKQYWFGMAIETDWKPGSQWRLMRGDGTVDSGGEIIEVVPERTYVLTWRHEANPEFKSEGYSRCRVEMEPAGAAIKLTIAHSIERAASKLMGGVSFGWPLVASNLKSLLETGAVAVTSL